RPVGGEVFSHHPGRVSQKPDQLVGNPGGELVHGQPGDQRSGAGAAAAFLGEVRAAHHGPSGTGKPGGGFGDQPEPPDRYLQPSSGGGPVLDAERGAAAPARSAADALRPQANRVNRLRNRLILVFLAATLVPLAATIWITTSLLDWSLNFSTMGELQELS